MIFSLCSFSSFKTQKTSFYKEETIEHLYYCIKQALSFIFMVMRLIATLFFCCVYMYVGAQIPIKKMYIKKLNSNNGLLQSTVQSSIIDANGLMWIGTSAGLQWYDGYNFYKLRGKGSEVLQTTTFVQLLKDSAENIWVVHSKGVIKYELKSGKFISIFQFDSSVNNFNSIHTLSKQYSRYIIIYLNENGFYKIDKQTNKISSSKIILKDIANGVGALIPQEEKSKDAFCYITTNSILNGGVYQIYTKDLSTKKIVNFSEGDAAKKIIGDSIIVLKRNNQLVNYNFLQKQYQTKKVNATWATLLLGISGKENNTQTIVWDSGLYKIYDSKQEKFVSIIADATNNTRFTNFNPYSPVYKDAYNNQWIGTSGDGLLQINTNALKFNSIIDYEKPENNFLRSIYWDNESQYLIAALRSSGFNIYNKNGTVVKRCSDLQGANLVMNSDNSVMQILKLAKGKYLMTNQQYPFITQLDLNDNKISDITYLLNNKYKKNTTINFYCSATSVNETTHYCMVKNELYKIYYQNNKPNMQLVFDLKQLIGGLFYDDNKILIGSSGKFLQIDTLGNVLQTINVDGDKNTLIKYFEKDKNNNIWIATTNGLYVWDRQHMTSPVKNIPDHFFYTLSQEKKSNFIWCSSNTGLYRINSMDKSFTQYGITSGLVSNEFNTNSCTTDADGIIYFGTPNGINTVDPSKINTILQAPTPTIISVTAGRSNLGMDAAINQLKSISFPFSQNDISINFASIDFSVPTENIYRYRFANNDTIWKEIGNIHTLNFVLQSGKYVFQVQAGKQLSGYNAAYKQIEIIIEPPFYKTWWFISLVGLLILSAVFALGYAIRNHIDRKKIAELKMQFQLQKERERISKDLHDNIGAQATALFYGIEGLEKEAKTEKLINLKETTQDMMDGLRETIWALGKGSINITSLSDRFKLFMKKIGKHYPYIQLTVQENITIDKTLTAEQGLHVLRILQEALNNAIKHADAKNIFFIVDSNKNISIKIKDDGKGLGKKTTSNFSDGNGMINMKERAAIAGFQLNINSNNNEGTIIDLIKLT